MFCSYQHIICLFFIFFLKMVLREDIFVGGFLFENRKDALGLIFIFEYIMINNKNILLLN